MRVWLQRAALALLMLIVVTVAAWSALPFGASSRLGMPGSAGLPAAAHSAKAGAAIKVTVGAFAHGSGVHIGNGLFLTAAHVVHGTEPIWLKTDRGWRVPAERLWANADYDAALLRVAGLKGIAAAPLSCRAPTVGDAIHIVGNPAGMEFVRTHGRIASATAPHGPWRAAMVVDITILSGMSGAPVFDEHRRIAGLAVGIWEQGTFARAPTGLGYIVPGAAICPLLGRA
jgi:serine protease Do